MDINWLIRYYDIRYMESIQMINDDLSPVSESCLSPACIANTSTTAALEITTEILWSEDGSGATDVWNEG